MIECNFHPGSLSYYRDYWITELDENGEILWQECYGGSHHEQGFDIIEENGGYTLLGFSYSNNGDVSGNNGWDSSDLWLLHIDSTGNLEWQNCYGGTEGEAGFKIFETQENGYVLIGISNSDDGDVTANHCWPSGSGCENDPWIVVLDSNRNILWENTYGGLQNGQMARNSAVQLGEMDFVITSQKYFEYEEYGGVTSDFNCTPYPIEDKYSAWIFRLYDTTIGANTSEYEYRSLNVYPNPATDYVYFELPENQKVSEIQILDVFGKQIQALKVLPQQTLILWELYNVNSGVYFYQTQINGEIYRGKIVVK